MLKKGDRIEFVHPGTKQTTLGVVLKGGATEVHVSSDSGETFRGSAHAFRPSIAPMPDGLVAKLSVGDRVEYESDGQTRYGVVVKGGSKVRVIADGGETEVRGDARLFKLSDKPLPKDGPHPMDAWGVKNYKAVPGLSQETVAFTAIVTLNDKPVLHVRNNGNGGCNYYEAVKGADHGMERRLNDEAKQWAVDHGITDTVTLEAADAWLDWKVNKAPYGVTAKAFFEDWDDITRAISEGRPFRFAP